MSAVDDLKNGNDGNTRRTNIDLSNITGNKPARKTMTANEIAKEGGVDEDERYKPDSNQTYIQSILDTNNPNSDFMKHVAEKTAEAQQWIQEQEEKKILEQENVESEEIDDDEDLEDNGGVVIDMTKHNTTIEEDLSNPEMTEGEDMSNANVISFDLTGGADENIEDSEPVIEEDTPVEEDVEKEQQETPVENVQEQPKEETKEIKKEMFTADDVDIQISQETESSIDENSGEEEDDNIRIDDDSDDNDEYDRLRKITTERLKPTSLNLNISSFTIAKKAKANTSAVFQAYKAKISKWVLFNQKSTIMMKEFSGSELEMMMEYYQASRRSPDAMRRMFQMIYDHIASPKPANFDTWLKVTPYSDIDNYFFAIYIASFNGANYIPIDCTDQNCKKSYITDDIDIIKKMVKFDSEEKKNEFAKLYASEVPPMTKGIYTSEVIPLSQNVAIGFKEPSFWDRIEIDSIDNDTANEFSSIISLIPYIDNIYVIDMQNQQLIPVAYKEFPENPVRTSRAKIKKYNSIFNSLTVDEFTPVKAYVSAMLDKANRGVTYVIPETICPECGHVNPETVIGQGQVADMVFTRCQLGALVTTSIN